MQFKPISNLIVIKREQSDSTSKGGIIIPHTAQQKSIRAQVIATGPGKTLDNGVLIKNSVKENDTVIIGQYTDEKITVKDDGQEFIFIQERDVLCVVEQIDDSVRLNPIGNLVMLKRVDSDAISKGGIIIPESARPKSIKAEVVAVGPGRIYDSGMLVEPSVKVGDIAILSKWAAGDVMIDGTEYTFIRETEIMGVYED